MKNFISKKFAKKIERHRFNLCSVHNTCEKYRVMRHRERKKSTERHLVDGCVNSIGCVVRKIEGWINQKMIKKNA